MLIGYARTSTSDQVAGFEAQVRDLRAHGCADKIFEEQVSSVAHRAQLDAALDFVREGDAFVVTRLDRLARSTSDLLRIVALLDAKGVALRILDFGGTGSGADRLRGKACIVVKGFSQSDAYHGHDELFVLLRIP